MRHDSTRKSALWGKGSTQLLKLFTISAIAAVTASATGFLSFDFISNWTW